MKNLTQYTLVSENGKKSTYKSYELVMCYQFLFKNSSVYKEILTDNRITASIKLQLKMDGSKLKYFIKQKISDNLVNNCFYYRTDGDLQIVKMIPIKKYGLIDLSPNYKNKYRVTLPIKLT